MAKNFVEIGRMVKLRNTSRLDIISQQCRFDQQANNCKKDWCQSQRRDHLNIRITCACGSHNCLSVTTFDLEIILVEENLGFSLLMSSGTKFPAKSQDRVTGYGLLLCTLNTRAMIRHTSRRQLSRDNRNVYQKPSSISPLDPISSLPWPSKAKWSPSCYYWSRYWNT